MDDRVNTLQQQVDDDCISQLKHIASKQGPSRKRYKGDVTGTSQAAPGNTEVEETNGPTPVQSEFEDPVLTTRIEDNMNEIIKISEEKMKRAQQIYDLVDQHIRTLDKDLKSFGAEVNKDRVRLGIAATSKHDTKSSTRMASGKRGSTVGRRKKGQLEPAVPLPAVVPVEDDGSKSPEKLYQEALAVADANEPKYCFCNRISFGEMIACDNMECPIEWFHFSCVGLTPENRPKGPWYCKDCRASIENRKQ